MSPGGLVYKLVGSGLWNDPVLPSVPAEGFVVASETALWVKVAGVWTNRGLPTDAFNMYCVNGIPGVTGGLVALCDMNTGLFNEHIFKSTDSGQTWTDITPAALDVGNLLPFCFAIDSDTYYVNAHADLGAVWRTTNGGVTWAKIINPINGTFFDAGDGEFGAGSSRLWWTGFNGALGNLQDCLHYANLDGTGQTVLVGTPARRAASIKPSPESPDGVAWGYHNYSSAVQPAIYLINGSTVNDRSIAAEVGGSLWGLAPKSDLIAVCHINGKLYKTTDGGVTWAVKHTFANDAPGFTQTVMYVNGTTWVALCRDGSSDGTIAVSTDDGETWALDATLAMGADGLALGLVY